MNPDQKFQRFAEAELLRNINKIIVTMDDGSIVAFGQYLLEPQPVGFHVRTRSESVHTFGSKRVAMAWCTYDRLGRYTDSNNVRSLDSKQQMLQADLECLRYKKRHAESENFKDLMQAKIDNKQHGLTRVRFELENYATRAKYLQIKGFKNETARTLGSKTK